MTTPTTESGRALLAKEDYAMPEDILAIEQEAASAAVVEVARLREALEPFAAAFTADRMPVTRRSAYEAVAALIAESREERT